MRKFAQLTIPLSLILFSLTSPAVSLGSGENPLKAQLSFSPGQTAAGGTVNAKIKIELDDDFHAYLDRFKLRLASPENLKLDDFKINPIVKFDDFISKGKKDGVEKSATLQATLEVPESFKIGTTPVVLAFTYQACTKDHCLFPKTIELKTDLIVVDAHADTRLQKPAAKSSENSFGNGSDFEKTLGGNTLSALLAVFIVGFLTSLTPCIYPMIPITLAILGTRGQNQSRLRGFGLSFVYVLGIAFTYSSLGIFAASTGSLFGAALSNPWVVSTMAFVFIIMALSMYGAFELQVPAFVRNRLGSGNNGKAGFGGAFLTGLLAGVAASPCVGPVLVSILTYIAQTQNKILGFLFLFTFAMGMGILFLILGTFSQLISRIPKSGSWMDAVKFIFGTTMVAMALYYVAPIYPAWLFDMLLGVALLLIASAYGAFEPASAHDAHSSEKPQVMARLRKGAMIAMFALGMSLMIFGALRRAGLVLPFAVSSRSAVPAPLAWETYSDERLETALKIHQPVIIDFSAEWCAACKELERDTFAQSDVRELSKSFVLLEFDATNESDELIRLKQKFAILGLPTLVFYDRHGVRRDQDLRLSGFEKASQFLKRMKAALI